VKGECCVIRPSTVIETLMDDDDDDDDDDTLIEEKWRPLHFDVL